MGGKTTCKNLQFPISCSLNGYKNSINLARSVINTSGTCHPILFTKGINMKNTCKYLFLDACSCLKFLKIFSLAMFYSTLFYQDFGILDNATCKINAWIIYDSSGIKISWTFKGNENCFKKSGVWEMRVKHIYKEYNDIYVRKRLLAPKA